MSKVEEKSYIAVLAEFEKELSDLSERVEKLTKVVNQNADLLVKALKQQEKLASMYDDVETLKLTLGTIMRVTDEIWKTKTLRALSEQLSKSAGQEAEKPK